MKYHLGVDPGTYGAAVVMDDEREILDQVSFRAVGTSWPGELVKLMCRWRCKDINVYVEHIHAMTKVGVGTMFEFGRCFGIILGACHGLGIPYELLTSAAWQKLAWDEGPSDMPWAVRYANDPKGRSLATARLYWKKDFENLFVGERGGVNDGLIDAALIAWAGSIKASTRIGVRDKGSEVDMVAQLRKERGQEKAKKSRKQKASFERKLAAQRGKL